TKSSLSLLPFKANLNPAEAYLYLSFQPFSPGPGSIKYESVTFNLTSLSYISCNTSFGQGNSYKCISFVLNSLPTLSYGCNSSCIIRFTRLLTVSMALFKLGTP